MTQKIFSEFLDCVRKYQKSDIGEEKYCIYCGMPFRTIYPTQLYCGQRCKDRKKGKWRGKRGKDKKLEFCECCGYDVDEALHFHHLDRKKKLGGLTLCANCHYIFHKVAGRNFYRDDKVYVILEVMEVLHARGKI